MPVLTAQQIAVECIQVGLAPNIDGPSLTPLYSQVDIATAIALAESGGNTEAIGDVALEDSTWGPSIGLWQVRTLKKPGNNIYRSASYLQQTGSKDANDAPRSQALAMMNISNNGTNWTPWSTYTSGAYRLFLPTAHNATQAVAATTDPNGGGDLGGAVPDSDGLPSTSDVTGAVSGVADALTSVSKFLSDLTSEAFWRRAVEILAGIALIVVGFVILNRSTLAKVGQDAAVAAVA